ncbi:MAG: CBS domain-containing protein [Thaumarchaeota archaeon]|nr:CBS domain-containing protein [Nitrososphaerota archaeon]
MTESIQESSLENVLVRSLMTTSVISVDSSTTAHDAAKLMEESKISSVVVFENNLPVGIITDKDFAIKMVAHAYPIDTPVRRVMSTPLITITSDSPFWVGADLMNSRKIKRLVVVDDEKVVGIITITDLVNHFIRHVKNESY